MQGEEHLRPLLLGAPPAGKGQCLAWLPLSLKWEPHLVCNGLKTEGKDVSYVKSPTGQVQKCSVNSFIHSFICSPDQHVCNLKKNFPVKVWLIYNDVLFFATRQSGSEIYMYSFHNGLSWAVAYSSLCYTVASRCVSPPHVIADIS